MTDDLELLRRFADDCSESAFHELVQRHLNLVYSSALRRLGGDVHLAEDATQQVFVALARQASVLVARSNLIGWLYTSARFSSAAIVRTERRRQKREQTAYVMNEETTPTRDWERLRPVIDALMDELSEHDQEALLLRFFSGCTFGQLSEKLQLSEEAARKRVDRALIRLRDRLTKRGIVSTATAVSLLLEANAIVAAPAPLAAALTGSAITAAASAGPAVGSTLSVLTNLKLTFGLVALSVVLLSGWIIREVGHQTRVTATLIQLQRENAEVQAKLTDTVRQVLLAEQTKLTPEIPRNSASSSPASIAASTGDRTLVDEVRDPQRVGKDMLARFPEMSALVSGNTRAAKLNAYTLLFQKLGLRPAQVERFLEIMEQTGGVRWNTQKQAPIGEITSSEFTETTIEPELRRLLGADGFQTYQDFNRQRTARDLVSRLGGSIYFTSDPLQAAQADQLVQILTQASPSYREGRGVDGGTLDWAQIFLKAQGLLDVPQFAALENIRAQDDLQRAIQQASRLAREKAQEGMAQPKQAVIAGGK